MLPIVAVCIIATVLVAEKLTGRLAGLLDHEIFARHAPRWRLFDQAPSDPTTTPEDPEGSPTPTDTTWSPGSAFIANVVLQLSCCLQPGGSTIFDGATGTWRLSPIYCLWDMAAFSAAVLHMVIRTLSPLRIAVAVVTAARYRSTRTLNSHTMRSMDQKRLDREGHKVHILQDVHDAFLLPSKRRIVAIMMTALTLLQFVKIMAVAEPFDTTGIVALLAGVYFTYWLFNETLIRILRFSSGCPMPADQVVALTLAEHHRPNWLFSTPLDAEQWVTQQGWNMFLGGLAHFLLFAAAGFIFLDIKVTGSGFPRGGGDAMNEAWVHFFGLFFFVLPLLALFLCVWAICDFTSGLGKDRWAIHFWYSLQGSQVVLLVLLFHLRLYDSSRTFKPSWLDWLP